MIQKKFSEHVFSCVDFAFWNILLVICQLRSFILFHGWLCAVVITSLLL